MKKSTKLLALTMTGSMLLIGCGDAEDTENTENDMPDIEESGEEPEDSSDGGTDLIEEEID